MSSTMRTYLTGLVAAMALMIGGNAALAQHHHHGHGHHHHGHTHFGIGYGGGIGFGYGNYYGYGGYYSPFMTSSWNTVYRPVTFSPYYCGVPTYTNWYGGSFGYGPAYGWGGYYPSPWYYNSPVIYGPSYYYSSPIIINRPVIIRRNVGIGLATVTAAEIERKVEVEKNARYTPINIADRAHAYKYLSLGDQSMREGRYSEAVRRYRQAEDAAPQMSEICLRKGHAYIANGQYRLATVAMKRGFSLNRDIARDGFTLDKLYGDNEAAKSEHLDKLAEASIKEPGNSDMYYLLGIMLHYDGKADRAQPFFAQARSSIRLTTPKSVEHLSVFAPRTEPKLPELPAVPGESKEESLVGSEMTDEI
jgi:hypothetical protein